MSPALCGSTHMRVPSFTCHPGRTSCFLKLCHPSSDLPSKSNFQPAAFSAAVRVLGAAVDSLEADLGAASSLASSVRATGSARRPATAAATIDDLRRGMGIGSEVE